MRGDRLTQAIEQVIAGEGTGSLEEALSESKKKVEVGNNPASGVNQIVVDEEEESDGTLIGDCESSETALRKPHNRSLSAKELQAWRRS